MNGPMHDDIDRLPALWQDDSGDAERLLAAVHRERRKQQRIVAGEWAICLAGVVVGLLLVFSSDPTRRVAGLLVIAYSLAGALVTQWARVAVVRRLSRPIHVATGQAQGDAVVVRRLTMAGWMMTGFGALFVAAVLATSGRPLRDVAADPEKLAVTLGAAAVLVGASIWQWRFARRHTDELKQLLESQEGLSTEPD
jgi:hypothetical protein